MSGVSLLASRLQSQANNVVHDPVWASHESVKLSDSMQQGPLDIRSQIESLISQSDAQERALLRYHAELSQRIAEIDNLKSTIISKNLLKYKYKAYMAWRSLGPTKPPITPRVRESVNLNDTLRNLALSLNSPLQLRNNLDVSTTSIKSNVSATVPFQIARTRPHFPPSRKV